MKKLLLTTLLLCAGLAATAYEYQFNWNQLSDQLAAQTQTGEGTLAELPTTGINILIHPTQIHYLAQNVVPYLHVYNDHGYQTTWPGVAPTATYKVALEGNENNKETFYFYHFETDGQGNSVDDLKLIANFDGNYYTQQTCKYQNGQVREFKTPGTYFFNYNPYSSLDYLEQYSSADETTFYVRVMNSNCTPTLYYWDYGGNWTNDQHEMEAVPDNENLYKYTFKTKDAEHGGVIISDHGNSSTQTADIKGINGGAYYLDWYPNGSGDRYDNLRYEFCGTTGHYKAWLQAEVSKEITFTTTNEHGTATLTIVCQNADDVSKIGIDQYGALSFPKTATINVSVDDGYYLNKVWFGVPSQGEHAYGFVGHTPLGSGYIEDMGVGDYNLLAGGDEQHLYMVTGTASQGFELVQKDSQGDRYYFSPVVKVYSEGTSLEDLVNAHHSVKRLNQAIDHDLVGVGVRTINGTNVLIARSVDYVANIYPIKEGQELLRDANGQPYEWSNPETKQYAWIALELPDGVNPDDYKGKQLSGIRGMYCPIPDGPGHLEWYNPCMMVESISQKNVVAEDVETHLITYSVACMTEQSYEHSFTGNRPTDQGSTNTTYQVTGKYYMLKPHLCEICNVIDIMRTDDEVIWIPDTRAIMPIANVDGREQIKPNIYTQNSIVGYANIEQSYSPTEIWKFADQKAGIDEGNRWKMRHKVYNIPEALLLASDFHSNDYPLSVPDRNYDGQLAEGGAIGLHIMGYAQLDTYDKDILVSNSDYWSRYNYGQDKNAYRNDLQIAVNPLSPKFAALSANGNHLVVERCYDNDRIKQQIATITIDEGSSESAVKYTVEYTDPGSLQDARGDANLLTITTPAADFTKTTFVIGDKTPDTYISIHDMFYSQPMTSKDENSVLYPEFIYHVRPANQGEGGSNATTDVAGYAPVYKTDVNVAGHSMYTKSQVDGDKDDHLLDDGKVKVYFTPNHATAVTRYDVLGGKVNDEGIGCPAKKSSTDLVNVDATNFMNYGIEIGDAEQYKEFVPEACTFYNDNTYGCYKEKVGNATVTMTHSKLYESTKFSGKTGEHIYFCNLDLSTVLTLVENDERYLLRVWRKVGNEPNEPKVLLNDLEEFTHEYFDMGLKIEDKDEGFTFDTEDLYTHYHDLNNWATKEAGSKQDVPSKGLVVPDMFKHKDIDETTDVTYIVKLYVQDNKVVDAAQGVAPAGAPRRAQDNPQAYYVKRVEQSVRVSGVITGIDGIHSDAAVSSVRYVNVAGQVSDKPWSGVNMVVTTLADGTTRTSKIVR